jgi:hypothetical protein
MREAQKSCGKETVTKQTQKSSIKERQQQPQMFSLLVVNKDRFSFPL